MEYFLCVSFIGTLVLLAAHAVDYALDVMRRPVGARIPDDAIGRREWEREHA
jgi:hypothetical protein